MKIISIATGKSKNYSFKDNTFQSAYKKDNFLQSAQVDSLGIEGDEQVDIRFHGGVDKAIHIGSYKHLDSNPTFDNLAIGCNILVDEVTEEDICLGDIYSIGEVTIQVTQPRQPCWKIGALFGKEVSRYISSNYATGWYVRVLKEGQININDKMLLEKRTSNLNMKELSSYLKVAPSSREIIDEVLNSEVVANSYRVDFLDRLQANNS